MTQQRSSSALVDGSYVGLTGRYWLALRVDVHDETGFAKLGAISGDLQSTGPDDGAGYASFRSLSPVGAEELAGPIAIEWIDANGNTVGGSLSLNPQPDDVLQVTIDVGGDIGKIRKRSGIGVEVRRAASTMRDLSVQIVVEDPQPDGTGGLDLDEANRFSKCISEWWKRAGFRLETRQSRLPHIPAPSGGWTESAIFSTLQNTLSQVGSSLDDRPEWDLHFFVLSGTDRTGLEGVMFDLDDHRPRQGAAIFVDSIRSAQPDPDLIDRRMLKTAVHELGHALNLRHRFDPVVRRTRSLSPMNYDWIYPDGADQYWENYGEGCFDRDELTFLRHGPRNQIIPGGAPFGTAAYWDAKASSSLATTADQPLANLSLWLTPPPAGPTFLYGQPIFLEVSLLNNGAEPIRVPHHILDLKAGRLAFLIEPLDDATDSNAGKLGEPFVPVLQRCFNPRAAQWFDLHYGDSLHSNANLSYGSSGPTFADPGRYAVTPVLTFPSDSMTGLDQVIIGPPLHIRVQPPLTRADARDAELLLSRSDIGISLALGGATCFEAAAGDLAEIRERRRRDSIGSSPDPIAVTIARTSGLFEQRKGNEKEAAALLRQATGPEAYRFFDPHTAEHTRRLAATLDPDTPMAGDPTRVVVDLWTARLGGGPLAGGRSSGRLITRGAPTASTCADDGPSAWGVLAPASQLPPEAMDEDNNVAAVVTIAAGDGLTHRVSASRIDLVPDNNTTAAGLALIELMQPRPIVPGPPIDDQTGDISDVASFFGPDGDRVVNSTGADLDPWAQAADEALANAPQPRNPLPPRPATTHRYPQVTLNDVAGWACLLIHKHCQEPPPADGIDRPYEIFLVPAGQDAGGSSSGPPKD